MSPRLDREGVPWCAALKCVHFRGAGCELVSGVFDAERVCVPAVRAMAFERDTLMTLRTTESQERTTNE